MRGGIDLTREKAAEFFGVDLRTIDNWLRRGCPGQKVGARWQINSAEVSQWLRTREREDALGETAGIDESEARRRKIAAEAALAEHELALKQGAAVPISLFEARMAAMIGAARAKALNLGAKLGPMVVACESAVEAKDLIDGAVREVLVELSEFDGADIPGGAAVGSQPELGQPAGREAVVSAAGSDRKRVGGRESQAISRGKR